MSSSSHPVVLIKALRPEELYSYKELPLAAMHVVPVPEVQVTLEMFNALLKLKTKSLAKLVRLEKLVVKSN